MSTGNQPLFISVCIPAYKHPEYLKRLLDSLAIQTFKDFEVIITDDSPDDSVLELSKLYLQSFPVFYYKNLTALGTPANWNEGIRKANGAWIKLIHDDDWLSSANSLQDFVQAIQSNTTVDFIYSAFRNVDVQSDENVLNAVREKIVRPAPARMKQLAANPVTLLSKNI
ncbi:MAG TPA: glycosyltransferase family A protein, partial [Flavitalea sp.]|nr:glycosyltransferase family A protein [Flavitalea sp.]